MNTHLYDMMRSSSMSFVFILVMFFSGKMVLPVVGAADEASFYRKNSKERSTVASSRGTRAGIRKLTSTNSNIFTMVKPTKNRSLMKMTMRRLEMSKPTSTKTSKASRNSLVEQQEATVEMVYALCDMFQVFDNSARGEHNIPGFEWYEKCDMFEPLHNFLCPIEPIVQEGICLHKKPYLNPAARQYYCRPLTSFIEDEEYRQQCESWCTNFVSADRGNCCKLSCPPPSSISSDD